ncbi:hypothetical protein FFI16_027425 [Pseudomonas sp. KBS0710]|uniref:hypothetical protein n=1 Tax=Pseudomonas sp. KBS0710 TaxID=1179667 RepID=UPI00110E89DA|nr:hypothetical protein [Pseudomonas sp. KBS0710]TSD80008.1 hypothetical protein FFI16_027425 [Pseudomonas sp. KBS0710]
MTVIASPTPISFFARYDQPAPKQESTVKIVHDRDSNGPVVTISVTHQRADIRIKKDANDNLVAHINGKPHPLYLPNSGQSTLNITTGQYSDFIKIDDNVRVTARVKSGDGDDFIQAGGGFTEVDAGDGDDQVQLSTGGGTAHGGAGDDKLFGGAGNSRLYGDSGENFFSTDIPAYAPRLTQIYSSGTHDTIRARAGHVDVTVYSGKTDIHVAEEASANIKLEAFTTGSKITKAWGEFRRDVLIDGAKRGRDEIINARPD